MAPLGLPLEAVWSGLSAHCLAFDGNDLYVGGAFFNGGFDTSQFHCAMGWHQLVFARCTGLTGSTVSSITPFGGLIYVAGGFRTASGVRATKCGNHGTGLVGRHLVTGSASTPAWRIFIQMERICLWQGVSLSRVA